MGGICEDRILVGTFTASCSTAKASLHTVLLEVLTRQSRKRTQQHCSVGKMTVGVGMWANGQVAESSCGLARWCWSPCPLGTGRVESRGDLTWSDSLRLASDPTKSTSNILPCFPLPFRSLCQRFRVPSPSSYTYSHESSVRLQERQSQTGSG